MFRCPSFARRAALAFVAIAAFGIALPATAQVARNFPQKALRGTIIINDPSDVSLNRKPAQLAPAARIRGQNNMIVTWGTTVGQKLYVNYTVDNAGLLQDIWILTDIEADKWPWPRTPEEAEKWSFDPMAQVWTKP